MFANHAGQELLRGVAEQNGVRLSTLISLLGQCGRALEHRGPIEFNIPPEYSDGVPDQPLGSLDMYAALTLRNYNGYINPEDGILVNGAALVVRGPMIGVANAIPAVQNVTINNIAYYTEDATYQTDNYAYNYYTVVDGTPVFHETYGVTQSVPSFSGGYPGLPLVSVKECADASGTGVTGAAFNAYMPRTMEHDPYVASGSVVGVLTMPDGTRIVTGPYNAPVRYYKATANWTNNSGGFDYVNANPCLDHGGSSVDTGTLATVTFGTYNDHPYGRDPNVVTDQIIAACQAPDGTIYCVDPSAYDARIGFMQPSCYSITSPQGWGLMDGTENGVGNGGSARVMTDSYCKGSGAEAAGATGGSADHTHDNHTTAQVAAALANHALSVVSNVTGITVNNHTGTTAPATTGITIANANTGITITDHTIVTYTLAAGGSPVVTTNTHTVNDPQHNHNINEPGAGTGHSHSLGTLTHTVNDSGHGHSLTGSQAHSGSSSPANDLTHSTESNDPKYLVAYWYERLDNSA